MENEFQAWREGAPDIGLRTARRFSEEMQRTGLALARRALADGMSRAELRRRMGVSEDTLRKWEKRKSALVEVEVVAEAEAAVVLRIGRMHAELTVTQLAELARRLW